ncbi:MAG: fimbria major subunit, partial [Prevotellaceae bacterium]|nr:fimbria major subunit [Prevotellaceae bacterium]
LSNSFYYLRRVSKDGTSTGDDFAYCGTEWYSSADETGNYVVDTDANDKENYGGEDMSANFEYYMFGTEGNPTLAGLDWTKLSDLEDSDNDNSWNSGNTYGDYHIWRYATENTIPAAVKNQKNGISTGIVFKGLINITDEELKANLIREDDEDGIIYVYENYLLGTWSRVEEIAENEEGKYDSYGESFCRSVAVALEEITEKENEGISKVQALADAGFTGYAPNDDGEYEVYYYYWNRHNDNGKEGVMGPMKFGVVRNNVYKLSVTDIALFGHPDPDNPDNPDPDRPDPDEPDEELKYYFKLEVQILPWVVRVNDITF